MFRRAIVSTGVARQLNFGLEVKSALGHLAAWIKRATLVYMFTHVFIKDNILILFGAKIDFALTTISTSPFLSADIHIFFRWR